MDGRPKLIFPLEPTRRHKMGWLGAFLRSIKVRFSDASRRSRSDLGRQGERLARKFLVKRGYRFLASNYTVKGGEVDLIMQDHDAIVFVEVKTRRNEQFASAEQAINYRKQRHLDLAARHFIAAHRLHDRPCRFDSVAVVILDQGKPDIRHQQNAFKPGR